MLLLKEALEAKSSVSGQSASVTSSKKSMQIKGSRKLEPSVGPPIVPAAPAVRLLKLELRDTLLVLAVLVPEKVTDVSSARSCMSDRASMVLKSKVASSLSFRNQEDRFEYLDPVPSKCLAPASTLAQVLGLS